MSKEKNCSKPGEFRWNELVTTDEAAAKKFYAGLFGWAVEPFGGNKDSSTEAGGAKKLYAVQARQHHGRRSDERSQTRRARAVARVCEVEDVDATAVQAARLGGQVMMPPVDVPEVGRIAVLKDPQGAAVGLFKPAM